MANEAEPSITEKRFDDRTALVTGSSRGVGASTAKLLATRGAKVVVNYRSSENEARHVVNSIRDDGGAAIAVQADVRDEEAVQELVNVVEDGWGTIDVLVNNANLPFEVKPLDELSWDEFSQKVTDELKAAFVTTQAVTPGMTGQGYGRIVYVSSGLSKYPRYAFGPHGVSKAALNGLSRYVAAEFGPRGIVANVVSPGIVRTEGSEGYVEEFGDEMIEATPLGRVAQPEDVARAIAMFTSRDAQFVTGTYTSVDGGLTVE